jgi:hypothetical protein
MGWCWSGRPQSPVGIAKGFVDAGAVVRGGREDHASIHNCDLIRRLATENRLWGAPRIHGELLKLGIAVSERTVSRYLPDRLTAPSQTWRTFLTNHLGDLAFISQVTSSSAPRDDDVVDAGLVFRPTPLLCDAPCASNQWAVVDWPPTLRRTSIGRGADQDHLHPRACTRRSSGRDPPTA